MGNVLESSGSAEAYWTSRDADPVKSQFYGIHPLTEIWCSPMRRTMQTIHPLSQTPVVRCGGPYYGCDEKGEEISGGNKTYKHLPNLDDGSGKTPMVTVYNYTHVNGPARLNPIIKTLAFEEGGVYEAVFGGDGDRKTPSSTIAGGGYTLSQIGRDFPGYQTNQTDGIEITENGWYAPLRQSWGLPLTKETGPEMKMRAVRFARILKLRQRQRCWEPTVREQDTPTPRIHAENILLVVHFDFIKKLLNALIFFDTLNPVAERIEAGQEPKGLEALELAWPKQDWRHFNTGVTIFDIQGANAQVDILRNNCIDHLAETPGLVSGFPLGYYQFS